MALSCDHVSCVQGVQEYVGLVCNGFLANVSLVIQSCFDMFVRRHGITG